MMDAYTISAGVSTARPTRRLVCLALVLFCVLLGACGASEPPKPSLNAEDPSLVLWPRAEKAVRLHFTADRDLNLYEGRPHSIQVCVYQLEKPDAFLDLAQNREGIATLLKAQPFDDSVKIVTRLFVQPFEDSVFALDRAENATFVGIVCGYFDATPENVAGIWEIKPHAQTTGHLFWSSTVYQAGTLDITLRLTAHAMMESGGQDAHTATDNGRSQ